MDENISLFQRIFTAARAHPEQIIVKDAERHWSWEALLARAHDYNYFIEEQAPRSAGNEFIPILVNRSGESIAAMLGCLLARRAFAPIDAQQPEERMAKAIQSIQSTIILNPGERAVQELYKNEYKEPNVSADDLIYILFTSGSTGTPKGVMVDYGNIENTMLWSEEILCWEQDTVIGCATNLFFDISIFDIFSSLYFNIPLAILSQPSDPLAVIEEIRQFEITSLFSAPVFFSQLFQMGCLEKLNNSTLRQIISGGDFFPPSHILAWRESLPSVKIFNVWGPTESSIVNTMHLITENDLPRLREGAYPPVGQAHPRMPFHIVDESLQILKEPRQRGEICMLGRCVTRGYLNDTEKTKTYYIQLNGQSAYRTQDLGYVDEQGQLYILGRMDSTVKISGYRIDLGEVECAASQLPQIYLAGAVVHELEPGRKELWLGIEPRDKNTKIDIFSIKQQLRKILPSYMVPKRIKVFAELPKMTNRKINRRAIADAI